MIILLIMISGLTMNSKAKITREWFKHLRPRSIKSWSDLERKFLHRFSNCDVEIFSFSLASTKQRKGEPIREYIERFRRTAGRTRGSLPQKELVEFCRQGLVRDIRRRFGVTRIDTWKELTQAGNRAELEIQQDL